MTTIHRWLKERPRRRLTVVFILGGALCCAAGVVWRRIIFKPKLGGHFGEDALGFRWQESDSFDPRWNDTEIGTFLASVVRTPGGDVAKGLSIKIGRESLGTVCYDLSTMTPRASWVGGFLTFDRRRSGIWVLPEIDGTVRYCDNGPAWGDARVHYQGLYPHADRVVLSYTVNGVRIDESPWAVRERQHSCNVKALRHRTSSTVGPANRRRHCLRGGARSDHQTL